MTHLPSTPGDEVGAATLDRLATAPRYNRWMFERLRPWLGDRVLEIGSGIGNLSEFLLDRSRVVLTDTDAFYLDRLRERFARYPHVSVVELRLPEFNGDLTADRLDTVICLNVLEHVRDDMLSLSTVYRLLQPGGRLVLLVPALPGLYGSLDKALGHFRRYTAGELRHIFKATGFRMRHLEYFNLAGWWFTGRVLRRTLIPTGALRWYDVLVPLFQLERFLPWRVGQSLIAVGEREA
jgi:SAM-dependent methyltransferase